jgi:hypothetical protein
MQPRRLLAVALTLAPGLAQEPASSDWAFAPLQNVAPPAARDAAWHAPIDRFVRQHLDAAGLEPAPAADLRTLLRRASFVLTGLPPSPDDVEALLADPHPEAFARAVDRLLASPHFGEHQARHWLDLARYSDSNGLDENLAFANAFRYRDWVVRAHNDDLPYDRFVTLQIAGDLLAADPAVGVDGHVATGFLAMGPRMLAEQDKEKLVLDTIDEQLDLVGRTVLGLTIGCARCHDHKFDPIPTRDYYALAGIFRSTQSFHDLEHVSKWFDRELADDAAIAARVAAERARDAAKKELEQATAAALQTQQQALVADAGRYLLAGTALLARSVFAEAESAAATNLRADGEHWGDATTKVLHTHRQGAQFAEWRLTPRQPGRHRLLVRYAAAESRPMRVRLDGVVAHERALDAVTGGWLPAHQQWHEAGTFEVAAGERTLRLEAHGPHVPHLDAWLLCPADGEATDLLPPVVQQAAVLLAARTADPLVAFWHTLVGGDADGFAARVAAARGKGGLAAALLDREPPATPAELAARLQAVFTAVGTIVDHVRSHPPAGKQLRESPDRLRLDDPVHENARALLFDRGGLLALPAPALRPFLPATTLAHLEQLASAHAAATAAVPAKAPLAMCVAETDVKELPIHYRGSHLTLAAAPTPRGVLSVLADFVPAPTMPATRSGRVEFAQWLFAPEQALAARVAANRIWQRAFGQGLVRSPSNFGRRGDLPVHGELLDWLAADLRAHGWSQKQLWRRILLSRTWQQSAAATPAARERDPDNRLHGRWQRQRLPAEAIRDGMLALAGTLDRSLGGSLLPTDDRAYVTNDQSNDAARYDSRRRSLYLPVIRNAMFDLFAAFDYADPSVHLEQRPQTATAPQALWLLNAPFVREQSQALAAASDDAGRIAFLWRAVHARAPSPTERAAAARWLAAGRHLGDAEPWLRLAQALFLSNEYLHVD